RRRHTRFSRDWSSDVCSSDLMWVAALLACLLTLDRMFQADFEDGSLDLLLIGPLPIEMLVLAKVIAHWLTSVLPLVLIAPILARSEERRVGTECSSRWLPATL